MAVVSAPLMEDWLPVLLALALLLAMVAGLTSVQGVSDLASSVLPVERVLESAGSLG
ncbi:MAG: hypothetical protein AB7P76_04005 [Candidatus Melainabacteria bacterium]